MPNVSTGGEGAPQPPEDGGGRLLARRYRLLTEVGHGGMGTVWHAHDEVLGRDVAVKEVILPYGLSEDEREIHHKRTFREARTAARLAHTGVVTVFDVVQEDERPWIIMELIQAPSLEQVIRNEGRLSPQRAADIGRQMLGALHTAHEAGVLHRDVKPSNVLVAPGDRAVLTDFGIATAAGDVTLTQTGLVLGSPAYIAPERARGRTAGPASDLWALGITLYAMVEGNSPYERPEPMASLIAIISEEPEPPEHAGPLRPVINGLLRKEPDERMTALETAALLDEIVRASVPIQQQTRPMAMPDLEPPGPVEPTSDDDAKRGAAQATEQPPEEPEEPEERAEGPEQAPSPQPVAAVLPATRAVPDRVVDQAVAAGDTDETADADNIAGAQATMAGRPPVTAPSPAEPTPTGPVPRSRRGATALAIAGIALVAVLILAVWTLMSRGDDGKKADPVQRTTQSAGASASPSTQPSRSSQSPGSATDVPEDFRLHRDPTGFSVAVPEDWSAAERRQGGVFFYSPDRDAYIQIDQTSDPKPSALADWQAQAKGAPGRFAGYQEIRVAPVTQGEPITDPTGKRAADWEFTWQEESTRTHVLDRGLVMNGHGYAILLSAPDDDWPNILEELAPVYESFTPAGT